MALTIKNNVQTVGNKQTKKCRQNKLNIGNTVLNLNSILAWITLGIKHLKIMLFQQINHNDHQYFHPPNKSSQIM